MAFPRQQQTDAANLFLSQAYSRLRQTVASRDDSASPHPTALARAFSALPRGPQQEAQQSKTPAGDDTDSDTDNALLPTHGLGRDATVTHLLEAIVPGLNGQALSGRYYGFVTGGVLPVAEAADNIVSALDQNVQVHLPDHSVSTAVEGAALAMLVSLLDLGAPADWPGRTVTTGATASNIMGLACGREAIIAARLRDSDCDVTVAEAGLLAACQAAGIAEFQVLTSMGHSSLAKAASIVGLGHRAVKELPASEQEPWRLDLDAVERELARDGVASIIVVSAGEVNTGRFALNALDMPKLRSLADRYKAWIHVDGAFGIFARALPKTDEFLHLHANVAGLELADSITADGHKLLNVPYDAGIFLCRDASIVTQVFQNPNAAYLASSASPGPVILSPLNVGIQNSRRFRALPIYAVLLSEGRDGVEAMLVRMVKLAREVARFIRDSEQYEWLPSENASLESTQIVVLFRAKDAGLNDVLVERINKTRKLYVSGTVWRGQKAARIAVSSWKVDVEGDLAVVQDVLLSLAAVGP
ncbi:pyridoxal phosphate-dependent transferase [Podospora appendiculata]|uniref:Pyridoxal phosphate-dependent transferase n=1 Tax=Podospora appendiculata TaxID=314037 RepID=A0AAE0X679_9PEZI|nr:pyridoxal phosphate-dependent transferase [Podospora appendiculata]